MDKRSREYRALVGRSESPTCKWALSRDINSEWANERKAAEKLLHWANKDGHHSCDDPAHPLGCRGGVPRGAIAPLSAK